MKELLEAILVMSLIALFGFLLLGSLIITRLDALLDLERRRVISTHPDLRASLSAKDLEMEMNSVNWKV